MRPIRITLKNYRAYSDSNPAVIEIRDQFTALLGSNNVGKSTIQLFLYELRPLFEYLTTLPNQSPGLIPLLQGESVSVSYQGTLDPVEIFHNGNERDIEFCIEILDGDRDEAGNFIISKVVAKSKKSSPTLWTVKFYATAAFDRALDRPQIQSTSPPVLIDGGLPYQYKQMFEVFTSLKNTIYIGPFRNALNVGTAIYLDLSIGSSFIDIWHNWKNEGNRAHTRAINFLTEDIKRLFGFNSLEINANITSKKLIIVVDGHSYRLEELGSGLAQFIIVLGNVVVRKPSLILIDEPEINLHPSLQIDFLLALSQHAADGCIFSTHSIGLARSVSKSIYSVKRGIHGPEVKPFEATHSYAEFAGELSFSAMRDLGFDRLLLVEGVSDVKTAVQFLRLVGKEHSTVVLPLGGNALASGGRDFELEELKRISSKIFALVDSERKCESGDIDEGRKKFKDTCERLGFIHCITKLRAIENYLPDQAIKAVKGDAFKALSPYELLKDASNPWSKNDTWRIARAMTLDDLADTDVGEFFRQI